MIRDERTFRLQLRSEIEKFLCEIHDSENRFEESGRVVTSKGNPGERATLRRASEPVGALTESTHILVDALVAEETRGNGTRAETQGKAFALAATLAALLASLRGTFVRRKLDSNEVQAKPLGYLAGMPNAGGNGPKLSRLRFGKLARSTAPHQRLKAFRELLQLSNASDFKDIDPVALAFLYLSWEQPSTQWQFARDYFRAQKSGARHDDTDQLDVIGSSVLEQEIQ